MPVIHTTDEERDLWIRARGMPASILVSPSQSVRCCEQVRYAPFIIEVEEALAINEEALAINHFPSCVIGT
jgi:hypothetical protein